MAPIRSRVGRLVATAVLVTTTAACTQAPTAQPSAPSTGRTAVVHAGPASAPTAQCRTTAGLPDVRCTPGATDPAVRDDNVRATICRSGYSARHRPDQSVTGPIKRERMAAYGFGNRPLGEFELDHLVPISLGGDPIALANLWVEFNDHPNPDDQNTKDRLEGVLFGEVCAGRVPLGEARRVIATDWVAAYRRYVGPVEVRTP